MGFGFFFFFFSHLSNYYSDFLSPFLFLSFIQKYNLQAHLAVACIQNDTEMTRYLIEEQNADFLSPIQDVPSEFSSGFFFYFMFFQFFLF